MNKEVFKILSNRELDVLACVAWRCSNKEIAKLLNISYRTVETHVHHILIKIGCVARGSVIYALKDTKAWDELRARYEKISQIKFCVVSHGRKRVWSAIFAILAALLTLPVVLRVADGAQTAEGYFCSRRLAEEQIESALAAGGIVALVGCGGAGKTILARKFLRRLRASFKYELNAETENSLQNSLFDLACELAANDARKNDLRFVAGISDKVERRKRTLSFLQTEMKKLSDWAIILDSLEDLKFLKDFCPSDPEIWGKGKIIVTTRNENIKTVRYLGEIRTVSVGELEEDEKAKLFESASGLPQNEETRNFLKQVPGYPLDVCSAACYVKSAGVSLPEYLKRTREISEEFLDVSSRLMSEGSNYDRTRYGIATSNFREILSKNKLFGELLTLICFFDSQKIPLNILRRMSGAVVADDLIFYLKQYSAISCDGERISIHRSARNAWLDYLLKETRLSEKIAFVNKAISLLTPYGRLETICDNLNALISHLESFLEKLEKPFAPNLERRRIDLLLTIGDIYRFKEPSSYESLKYFRRALAEGEGRLSETETASINFRIGGALSRTGKNDEALKYLSKSLKGLEEGKRFEELARSYCAIGIISARKNLFQRANENFEKAIEVLGEADRSSSSLDLKLARVGVYRNMALNYFTEGIDRENGEKAIGLMKKAVDILRIALLKETPQATSEKIICDLISCKSRLAGIYNAFGEYDRSLKEGREAEVLIQRLSSSDNGAFCAGGILLLKRGVSYLRLGKIKEAEDCLARAKAVFSKAMMSDYLFRLKAREIEVLIGLNRLDEAFSVCEEIFAAENRERNNYCDLLFYSRYYCAAVVKYRQNDPESARKYFQKFFRSMKELCVKIVPKEKYGELIEENVFEENPPDLKTCFENSLEIFKSACGKDRGFVEFCARNKI